MATDTNKQKKQTANRGGKAQAKDQGTDQAKGQFKGGAKRPSKNQAGGKKGGFAQKGKSNFRGKDGEKSKGQWKGKASGKTGERKQGKSDGQEGGKYGKGPKGAKGNHRSAFNQALRPGDTLPALTIKRLGINGEGVAYYKKKVAFVQGALPEEVVSAKITKVERNFIEAEVIKVKKVSAHRQEPDCPVYAECGGCQLQHMSYQGQLKGKQEVVEEAFQKYTSLYSTKRDNPTPVPLRPIIGMDNPWQYRNKAQLQVGKHDGKVVTGLYAQGSHRLIDLADCPVQHPRTNEVVQITRDVLQQLNIPIYDERKQTGVVRTVVARIGFETDECQLVLVTAQEKIPRKKELLLELRYRLPFVTSIVQNINPKKTSLIFGDQTNVLWGEETIAEQLGDVQFSLSPRAFFQLNPEQTVKLYNVVREATALTGKEMVVDAYCGVGTIGLWLAPDAGEVRGVEIIAEAVENAKRNAAQSGIDNISFYTGEAEKLLPRWVKEGMKPDVVVVDPPRTGCDRKLLQTILDVKPKRFVYVSCNPSTLAKDCDVLVKGGYEVEWVHPVDMFPQTSHVESVALLVRKH